MAATKKKPGSRGGDEQVVPGGPAGSYDDWTVPALRQRARELGLSGYSGKKKSALVALLRGHQPSQGS